MFGKRVDTPINFVKYACKFLITTKKNRNGKFFDLKPKEKKGNGFFFFFFFGGRNGIFKKSIQRKAEKEKKKLKIN